MSRRESDEARRVALLFGSFRGGGVARTMLRAARGFVDRGYAVDVVVGRDRGDLKGEVPAEAGVVVLRQASKLKARAYILCFHRP